MHFGKKYTAWALTSLLVSVAVSHSAAKELDILASIHNEMEHFSTVATITKDNEHYQPYIISVFQGKELSKLGIANLKEALLLVPGVDMATDNFNNQTPIFRGSNPLAYGQSKLFIDGTLINNVFFDAYSEYLSMPVEMIKRIEVVRGPGSKTDGVNAYAGSINVITYAERFKGFESTDKALFKAGSYEYKMGGFVKTYQTENLTLFTDFFYQVDDKRLYAGPDGLSQGVLSVPALGIDNTHLSQSDDAPVWTENYALGMQLNYRDFILKGRFLDHTQGSAYGINLALPQDDDRIKLPNYMLELGYNGSINDFGISVKAGVKHDAFDSKAMLAPAGTVLPSLSDIFTNVTYDDGFYGIHQAEQRTLYHSAFLKYNGFSDHKLTLGYRMFKEETYNVKTITSDRDTGSGLIDYSDSYSFFDEDAVRETYIFALQDEYTFSKTLAFMYGFNVEKTTRTDTLLDPRLSMVYQPDARNIFKAIYSRSHRNASWQEMYTKNNRARVGNPDLAPERVDATELAYIRKFSTNSYLQANLFYLQNKDQISNSTTQPEYANNIDTDIYGMEFEFKGNLSANDHFYLNYSFVQGEDSNDQSLANVAEHMAKGYYTYNVTNALSASGIIKYVGAKPRIQGDTRDDVDAYSCVDATVRYDEPENGYTLMLSVKNIFDADIRYPSVPNSYIEDYRQESRNFMFTLVKEF